MPIAKLDNDTIAAKSAMSAVIKAEFNMRHSKVQSIAIATKLSYAAVRAVINDAPDYSVDAMLALARELKIDIIKDTPFSSSATRTAAQELLADDIGREQEKAIALQEEVAARKETFGYVVQREQIRNALTLIARHHEIPDRILGEKMGTEGYSILANLRISRERASKIAQVLADLTGKPKIATFEGALAYASKIQTFYSSQNIPQNPTQIDLAKARLAIAAQRATTNQKT